LGTRKLTLWSGVGLVMSNMIGTGVLTTAGYLSPELSAAHILLGWVVGGVVALAGAVAYAALARQVPRSGGEYRYLSSLLHPAAGYVAGWASLLVGFTVPVAVTALAAGTFAETVIPGLPSRLTAVAVIVAVTAVHAANLRASKWTQDVLAAAMVLLLVGFIAIGLTVGDTTLPARTPEPGAAGVPVRAFFSSLILIMFCYSGWNAAIYASEEFEDPRRDVPRAMLVGCVLVTVLYLLVNAVLVMNLTPSDMEGWSHGDTRRITLAHVVMEDLLGSGTARVMSLLIIVALMSAISAMTVIGPRVYAAMARDRFLPAVLAARQGRPPFGAVLLQSGLAIVLVFVSEFRDMLNNVGAILAIVSAVTMLALFRRSRWRAGERPSTPALVGALVFASMSVSMVFYAMQASETVRIAGLEIPTLALWMAGIVAVATIPYVVTRMVRPDAGAPRRRRSDDQDTTDWSARRSRAR